MYFQPDTDAVFKTANEYSLDDLTRLAREAETEFDRVEARYHKSLSIFTVIVIVGVGVWQADLPTPAVAWWLYGASFLASLVDVRLQMVWADYASYKARLHADALKVKRKADAQATEQGVVGA